MRMRGWVSSLCFRILTVNNTNPDILFATEFILIQMTATVTVLLLFIPKASFFLIHRTWRNLKHQYWPILTLEDFFRVHIDSYKRGGGLGEFERAVVLRTWDTCFHSSREFSQPSSRVFRWSYLNTENVLYYFNRIFLKNNSTTVSTYSHLKTPIDQWERSYSLKIHFKLLKVLLAEYVFIFY